MWKSEKIRVGEIYLFSGMWSLSVDNASIQQYALTYAPRMADYKKFEWPT